MPSTRRDGAPIILFAFNRPAHTLRALESLAANPLAEHSTLYIYCDGPKRWEGSAGVRAVREVVRQKQWCGEVRIRERIENAGLASSVIHGVTEVMDLHGEAIVIEDDLVLSPDFLRFMNAALDAYRDAPRVMQVSGYMYPIERSADAAAAFLPLTSSWGWATWARAWKHFDGDMRGADGLLRDAQARYRFDLDGSHPCTHLIELQRAGRMDSWAIRWYLSVFLANGLVLYPPQSLVQNGGFDGTGTHCTLMNAYQVSLAAAAGLGLPSNLQVDPDVYRRLVEFHRTLRIPKPPLFQRLLRRLRYYLPRRSA
ncbi:MAG: glycosyltransferase family 2 protein [Planctomycetia bacterium]|nr:glycosyltransferase family 2 protein [Planctomycetia bacterium]